MEETGGGDGLGLGVVSLLLQAEEEEEEEGGEGRRGGGGHDGGERGGGGGSGSSCYSCSLGHGRLCLCQVVLLIF